jgi:AraC-like DNA-binding protein
LRIVAEIFDPALAGNMPSTGSGSSAADRFRQFVATMPEFELINYSPAELARLCGCSSRHFNRLFWKHFGASVRARQTELRLLRARQLLGSTDGRIVQVAFQSGYRNLSLFNSLFKRRFGMTPSEWRRQLKTDSIGVRPPRSGAYQRRRQ